MKIEEGKVKPKNHIGTNIETWNKEHCLNEVLNYEKGDPINTLNLQESMVLTIRMEKFREMQDKL